MGGVWRLGRNRIGRVVYESLYRVGVTATVMYEYERELDTVPDRDRSSSVPVERSDPGRVKPLGAPVEELVDGEEVIAAFGDDGPCGYLFLSVDATHAIHPLERRLTVEGGYLRRVHVDPGRRNEGIASALVGAACRRAEEQSAATATALVALDNRPSRSLFETHAFERVRDHRYVRLGPLTHRSTAERRAR